MNKYFLIIGFTFISSLPVFASETQDPFDEATKLTQQQIEDIKSYIPDYKHSPKKKTTKSTSDTTPTSSQ